MEALQRITANDVRADVAWATECCSHIGLTREIDPATTVGWQEYCKMVPTSFQIADSAKGNLDDKKCDDGDENCDDDYWTCIYCPGLL